ncbi:MAG: lytic transglycosylase domain-containing protein [Myxococcaceae bacterium]|nr:lytic transglycosylase domain-containing protein [Myxococcaceae bacterium]MCI0670016.1 lytic transglycosylase domain-containing protein [Myxococcaceae bacterium]
MRGWLLAWVLLASVGHADEVGGPTRTLQEDTHDSDMVLLRRALAEKEATVRKLKARIEELEAEAAYRRAEALGVAKAVRATGLPQKQQRRLAVTILREAERHGLDPLLVVAVIRSESSFNPYAVSRVGALGLMQLMPDTGRWLMQRRGQVLGRTADLFETDLNVALGTAYLAELLQRFGTVERALVAYNAGPGAAKKILSHGTRAARFIAGYPVKVVRDFQQLKAVQQAELSRRLAEAVSTPTS